MVLTKGGETMRCGVRRHDQRLSSLLPVDAGGYLIRSHLGNELTWDAKRTVARCGETTHSFN